MILLGFKELLPFFLLCMEMVLQFSLIIRKFSVYYTTTVGANLILHRKGMQKNVLIRKFNLFKNLGIRTIFILHRKGCKITKKCVNSEI